MIALLVFNILYLAGTGKHLISGNDIAYYAKEVRSETVKTIKADRGNIYSFDNDLIATDRIAYNVVVYMNKDRPGIGDEITYVDKPEITAEVLSHYLSDWNKDDILEKLTAEDLYQYTFKAYLSSVQVSNLQEEMAENQLNGIEFSKTASRSYQYKHFSSLVMGLVNLNDDDPDHVIREGAFGLELALDDYLSGTDGKMVYQADTNGRAIYNARLTEEKAVNGANVYLSLDSELQNMLEMLIDDAIIEAGADMMWCGVMDAHTGRMMAMVSRPDFDLQDRSSLTNYQDLFLNHTYEVGSVVKPFVYLTAIDSGVYDGDELYESGTIAVKGAESMGNIKDFNYVGWGMIPYDEGLIHSSNTAIVRLIQEKGIFDDVVETFDKIGFFQSDTIDGLDAVGGWSNYQVTESPYDMVTMCFGQSATFSPYEVLRAFSVFANDGKIVEPYLVDHIIDANGQTVYSATAKTTDQIFSKDAVDHVRGLLKEVVNNMEIGTGTLYHMDDLEIFGKTGTGEVWDNDAGAYSKTRKCVSFVGGAPADDPQVLIFIGLQGYEEGYNATAMSRVVHTILPQALAKLNVSSTGNETKITDFSLGSFVNQSVAYAKKRLEAEGVKYVVIGDGGVVKRQTPEANTDISTANTIYLLSDATNYTLPDFVGWSRKDIASYMQLFDISVTFEGSGKAVSQSAEVGTDITSITELTIQLNE